jgi:hypothetical protein
MVSDFGTPSWRLDDAALIAAANPYTFYKPSSEAIALLRAGNAVKLIFAFESKDPKVLRAERMWVRIERVESGRFVGKLDNDPRYIEALKCGDDVEFEARHVIQTDIDDPVPDPTKPYWPRCYVSHRVLNDGVRVGYLYREVPDGDNDSGWRMMAGDESDEYINDSANLSFVSLGAVLREDASIVELLETPAPCAFVRSDDGKKFKATDPPESE